MNFNFDNNMFGSNPNFHGNGDFIVFGGKNVCTAQSCNCYVCQRNQQAKQNEYAMYNFEDANKMAKQKEALRRQRVEKEADRKQAKRQEALRRQRVEEEADRKRVKQKEALRRQRVEEEADRKRVKQIEALRRQRVEEEADRKQARFWKANGAFFMVSID